MTTQYSALLTPQQSTVLELLASNVFLREKLYFTGGTALSAFYLNHRYSDDLDFFSNEKLDSFQLNAVVQGWADKLHITYTSRQVENTYLFFLKYSNDYELKVDFAYYPYLNIEELVDVEGLKVNSKKDIAVNKCVTVSQRFDVKDFVDLFYLLKEYSIYELHGLANKKFNRDYDLILLAADLLKVEQFEYLPRMILPLSLGELKEYFVGLAGSLGTRVTKS